jgi:hypothetical protein
MGEEKEREREREKRELGTQDIEKKKWDLIIVTGK